MTQTKSTVRKELLQIRNALSPSCTAAWSAKICRHIQSFIQAHAFQQGMGFLAFPGEPDLRSLMGELDLAMQWGVPKVREEGLCFYPWPPSTPLCKSPFGFWEPEGLEPPFSFSVPTLILVPALGLDAKGHRIGFGKGHYDRFLAQLDPKACITMGVVYDACLREVLPQDPWDIPLQYCCTESGWRAT